MSEILSKLKSKKPAKKPTDGLIFKVDGMEFKHRQHTLMQYGNYFIPGYILINPVNKNVHFANNYTGSFYYSCGFPDGSYGIAGALYYLTVSYGNLTSNSIRAANIIAGGLKFNPKRFVKPKGFEVESTGLEDVKYIKDGNYFKINTKGYPYCCGSTMLYGYYYTGGFSKEDIKIIRDVITQRTTNTNVIVRGDNKSKGLGFFKAAKFKIVDTWVNKNSGNELHLMTYNKK